MIPKAIRQRKARPPIELPMMRPRGGLEVREYDMLSALTEGVGNAGVSNDADPAAPGGIEFEFPGDPEAEAPGGGALTDVDAKTW
jgi:hypothetical protein